MSIAKSATTGALKKNTRWLSDALTLRGRSRIGKNFPESRFSTAGNGVVFTSRTKE
jgi:hypothetical protein